MIDPRYHSTCVFPHHLQALSRPMPLRSLTGDAYLFSFFRISGSEVIGYRLCSVGLAPYARLSERTSRRSVFVTAFIFSSLQSLSPFFYAVNLKKHFLNKKTAQCLFPFHGQMLHSVLTVSCSAARRKIPFSFLRSSAGCRPLPFFCPSAHSRELLLRAEQDALSGPFLAVSQLFPLFHNAVS